MPIAAKCKGCGKTYRVKDDLGGKRFSCKTCGEPVSVPQASKPAEEDDFSQLAAAESQFDEAPRPAAPPKKKPAARKAPRQVTTYPEGVMPPGVMVAVVTLGILCAWRIGTLFYFAGPKNPAGWIQLVVALGILSGLASGKRWVAALVVVLSGLGAAAGTYTLFTLYFQEKELPQVVQQAMTVMAVQMGMLWVVFGALLFPSSRAYYR